MEVREGVNMQPEMPISDTCRVFLPDYVTFDSAWPADIKQVVC